MQSQTDRASEQRDTHKVIREAVIRKAAARKAAASDLDGLRRLIRLPEVSERLGLGRSAILEGVKKGLLPKPVKVMPGGRAVAWDAREIDQYIADRLAER